MQQKGTRLGLIHFRVLFIVSGLRDGLILNVGDGGRLHFKHILLAREWIA